MVDVKQNDIDRLEKKAGRIRGLAFGLNLSLSALC